MKLKLRPTNIDKSKSIEERIYSNQLNQNAYEFVLKSAYLKSQISLFPNHVLQSHLPRKFGQIIFHEDLSSSQVYVPCFHSTVL